DPVGGISQPGRGPEGRIRRAGGSERTAGGERSQGRLSSRIGARGEPHARAPAAASLKCQCSRPFAAEQRGGSRVLGATLSVRDRRCAPGYGKWRVTSP